MYQHTNRVSKHVIMLRSVFSTCDVNISSAPVVVTYLLFLALSPLFLTHLCMSDVPVSTNLLCHFHKISTTSTFHAVIKNVPQFHQQLIATRKRFS